MSFIKMIVICINLADQNLRYLEAASDLIFLHTNSFQ